MKTRLHSLAAILILPLVAHADDPPSRYVIVPGTVSLQTGQEKKVIFKIDTTTGATWQFTVCTFYSPDGSYQTFDGWTWVSKDASANIQEFLKKEPNATLNPPPRKP